MRGREQVRKKGEGDLLANNNIRRQREEGLFLSQDPT